MGSWQRPRAWLAHPAPSTVLPERRLATTGKQWAGQLSSVARTCGGMRCHMLRSTVARSASKPPAAGKDGWAGLGPGAPCLLSQTNALSLLAVPKHCAGCPAMSAPRPHSPAPLAQGALTAVVMRFRQAPDQAGQVGGFKPVQLHCRPPPQRRVRPPQQRARRAVAQAAKGPQHPGQRGWRAGRAGALRRQQLLQAAGGGRQGRRGRRVVQRGKGCGRGSSRAGQGYAGYSRQRSCTLSWGQANVRTTACNSSRTLNQTAAAIPTRLTAEWRRLGRSAGPPAPPAAVPARPAAAGSVAGGGRPPQSLQAPAG